MDQASIAMAAIVAGGTGEHQPIRNRQSGRGSDDSEQNE
jgi:hypothetical protein